MPQLHRVLPVLHLLRNREPLDRSCAEQCRRQCRARGERNQASGASMQVVSVSGVPRISREVYRCSQRKQIVSGVLSTFCKSMFTSQRPCVRSIVSALGAASRTSVCKKGSMRGIRMREGALRIRLRVRRERRMRECMVLWLHGYMVTQSG